VLATSAHQGDALTSHDTDQAASTRRVLLQHRAPHFDLGRRAVEILLDGRTASGSHTAPMPLNAR
jgi:hypothetical protein